MKSEELKKSRYEYGRHETFAIRHGWLGKGLDRMEKSSDGFKADDDAVVELGLGSRMVKSLRYWLEASGLGELLADDDEGRVAKHFKSTRLGQVISERDPYLEYPATWWFIHLNLARRDGSIWGWFFNDFRERVFDRATCLESFLAHLKQNAANEPSKATAQRDVACLLSTYSSLSGTERADPEDGTASPLRDLGLLVHHADTRRFERTRPLDEVPLEAFLACVAAQTEAMDQDSLSLPDLLGRRRCPGSVFNMSGDAIEEFAGRAARQYASAGVTLDRLGAERRLRVPAFTGEDFWLDRHFERVRSAT